MNLKQVLLELKKLLANWNLDEKDWSLFLHYADILQGYDIKYERDEHLHIIIPFVKFPWKINVELIDNEVNVPLGTDFEKDFENFIDKTGFDFHILPTDSDWYGELRKKYSINFDLPQGEKINMFTTEGNFIWLDKYMEKWIDGMGQDKLERRLGWPRAILVEAKKKKDEKIVVLLEKYVKKYEAYLNNDASVRHLAINKFNDDGVISGEAAFSGQAKGRVVVCKNIDHPIEDATNLILVASNVSPKMTKLIKNCLAVITDEGGILSHVAIVARELKKPCIIGTKVATDVLKDGDEVEVDAEKGIIKKL